MRIAFNINVDRRPRQAERGRTENVDLVLSDGESFECRPMLWRRRCRTSRRPERVGELEHCENSSVVLFFPFLGGEGCEQAQIVFLHCNLSAACLEFAFHAMFDYRYRGRRRFGLLLIDRPADTMNSTKACEERE